MRNQFELVHGAVIRADAGESQDEEIARLDAEYRDALTAEGEAKIAYDLATRAYNVDQTPENKSARDAARDAFHAAQKATDAAKDKLDAAVAKKKQKN